MVGLSGSSWCAAAEPGSARSVSRLQLEQAALLEDARQGQRLQRLLSFEEHYIYVHRAAQVIGTAGTDQSRVLFIDKGSRDGLKPDMAVITPDGIVGKLKDVFAHTSQVLEISDQTSGAGVLLESTVCAESCGAMNWASRRSSICFPMSGSSPANASLPAEGIRFIPAGCRLALSTHSRGYAEPSLCRYHCQTGGEPGASGRGPDYYQDRRSDAG